MPRHLLSYAIFVLALAPTSSRMLRAETDSQPADVVFLHGVILTGTHLRPGDLSSTPARVTAMAVAHGYVLAAGTDAEVMRFKGVTTKVVDLRGSFVLPGFNDAHTHMAEAGRQKLSVDLVGARSLEEMQERIREYVRHAAPGSWISGGGWDQTLWASKQLPTRQDLDTVTGGHPAILSRVDGHIALANTAALATAGIEKATTDPSGSKIDRSAEGVPTGILREAPAMKLVSAKIPPPSLEQRRRAVSLAIDDALAHGVTSVQDNSEWEDFLALEEMEHAHLLKLRVAEWMSFDLPLPVLRERRASHASDDALLHLTQLKGFLDGSLGSRTAALEEPYADDADNSGLPQYDDAKLNAMATERAAAGFQIGLHAIGDLANTMALDAFAAADASGQPANRPAPPSNPDATVVSTNASTVHPADLRLRVEHAQVLLPGDFERFASLGVIASMQPSHLLTDMNWAGARLGPDRSKYAYAWHSFLQHGVVLAFGTDYPVESINPFRGIYAATTRRNEAGTRSFEPQEAISLNEALFAYTQASAFAEFRETVKGRLEPGMLADFVVVDRDVTTARAPDLLGTHVLRTVVGGETVFEANETRVQGALPSQTQDGIATSAVVSGQKNSETGASATGNSSTSESDRSSRSGTSHPPE